MGLDIDKNKIIYVASPYSSGVPERVKNNFEVITKYVADLVSIGYIAISPITYGHVLLDYAEMPSDYFFWQHFCIGLLAKCDCLLVVQMPGWELSVGMADEIKYAKENNIPITYITLE